MQKSNLPNIGTYLEMLESDTSSRCLWCDAKQQIDELKKAIESPRVLTPCEVTEPGLYSMYESGRWTAVVVAINDNGKALYRYVLSPGMTPVDRHKQNKFIGPIVLPTANIN